MTADVTSKSRFCAPPPPAVQAPGPLEEPACWVSAGRLFQVVVGPMGPVSQASTVLVWQVEAKTSVADSRALSTRLPVRPAGTPTWK
ncbi:hypothetical protein ACFQ0M_08575 [Kitasatospora aburaviensis]